MPNPVLLLVDDEPLVRESLAEYLGSVGFNLCQAESEDEAMALALKAKPDVVVSDLMLGTGSGLSLFSRIKKELAGKEEPCCILMTGFGSVENAVQALRGGVDDYLLKPINLAELNSAVTGGLARRRFRGQASADPGAGLADRFYHEVSAPLTVLRAYLDMFAEGRFGPLTMVQESKMEVVKKNMKQVLKVMRGFHHRIEDLPPEAKLEDLEPGALLRDVQQAFFLDFERRGVNLILGLPHALPKVQADRRQAIMLMEALIGICLGLAKFGMTLRIRWIKNASNLTLQFRLEPWTYDDGPEMGIPVFDLRALAAAGMSLDTNADTGTFNLVFVNPLQ